MIRKLVFIAPFALLGLSACDGPSVLTKAQPGECYAVTGRESNGAPKWSKTACAADQAAGTAAAVATADGTTPDVASPACPAPVDCPTVAASSSSSSSTARSARAVVRHGHHVERRAVVSHRGHAERRTTTAREYARVPQDDYAAPSQGLLGGPEGRSHMQGGRLERRDEHAYSYRSAPQPYQPLPPLPPVERYEKREHAYSYDRGAPPPPPPHYDGHAGGYEGHSYSEGYASRGERRGPPPAVRTEKRRDHSEGYSSREVEQRSYSSGSSSSSSSSYGYGSRDGGGPCCQAERGNMAPMNGPHFPVDRDGFLTWRGKTPAY